MHDPSRLVHLIEDSLADDPRCTCGAPMTVVELDGALWLDCSVRPRPGRTLLARVASFDWLRFHDRRLLLDRTELAA
jgi:hypothetical protein